MYYKLVLQYCSARNLIPCFLSPLDSVPIRNVEESPEYGVRNAPPGRPEHPLHALIAGAVGGYFVWGKWSALSHQVLMYVSIRVMTGIWKLLPIHKDEHWQTTHRLAATVVWALVMYLWESSPEVLQSSMRKSMDEIYDSNFFGLLSNTKKPDQTTRIR